MQLQVRHAVCHRRAGGWRLQGRSAMLAPEGLPMWSCTCLHRVQLNSPRQMGVWAGPMHTLVGTAGRSLSILCRRGCISWGICMTYRHCCCGLLPPYCADLLGKLSGERSRWEQQHVELDVQLGQLHAAALLLAAFVTYLPSHPEDVRERVLSGWSRWAREHGKTATPDSYRSSNTAEHGCCANWQALWVTIQPCFRTSLLCCSLC